MIGSPELRRILGGGDLTRLRGTIGLHVPIRLEPGTDRAAREVVLDLAVATARVTFSPPRGGDAVISSTVGLLVSAVMTAAIENEVHGLAARSSNPRLPIPLRVDPDANPSLAPLVVADAALVVFAPPDPARQSVAVFGYLAPPPHGAVTRTESAVLPGANFTFALSPATFRRLVFVVALQQAWLVARPDMMPSTIGEAESVPYPGLPHWSITLIEGDLGQSALNVHLQARYVTEGTWGNTTRVDVRGHLSFAFEEGRIVSQWHTDGIAGWKEFGVGWWLAAAFGPGITMLAIDIITAWAVATGGNQFAPSLPSAPGPPLGLTGARVTGVDVDSDHFALNGVVPGATAGGARFTTSIAQTVVYGEEMAGGTGTYTSVGCPEGDFAWAANRRIPQVTFTPRAVFGAEPVQFEWRVWGFNSVNRQLVGQGSSYLRISAETTLLDPPPGHVENDHALEIGCDLAADGTLTITGTSDAGNYRLDVECTATDSEGRQSVVLGYARLEPERIEFADPWRERLTECARQFREAFQAGLVYDILPVPGSDEEWRYAMPPAELASFVLDATVAGRADTLRNIEMTYGAALVQAFASHQAPEANTALVNLQSKFMTDLFAATAAVAPSEANVADISVVGAEGSSVASQFQAADISIGQLLGQLLPEQVKEGPAAMLEGNVIDLSGAVAGASQVEIAVADESSRQAAKHETDEKLTKG